ncbi:hypothetical protein GCM10011502_26290 [Oceanisphaera marina]|uniref:Glycosyl transferase family 1 domain-containing protein n=1 Tax=Oceanisphaera marina TaxID=2017550 RepID=A0ABQ1ITW4_9GAMM|nr:hypothetical protein [Oceanisphaera marina]GGB51877.1 hypothetical protein GCM10011502_26290 [Oceanisphaera marina]
MKGMIISRFGRTDARRGGGIYRTAKLSSEALKKNGFHIDEIADKLDHYKVDEHNFIWIYTGDFIQISDRILNNIDPTDIPLIINSGWVPDVNRERWMIETLERYILKFPNLIFNTWTHQAKQIIEDNNKKLRNKIVYLPHIQNINSNLPVKPFIERKGVCIGELGKIQRVSLSSFSPNLLIDKLVEKGFKEDIFTYGQYAEENRKLRKIVKIIPKQDQLSFFETMSNLRAIVWLTDKETFAAPPLELAQLGVIPILPNMPQSLNQYVETSTKFKDENDAAEMIINLLDEQKFKSEQHETLKKIRKIKKEILQNDFYKQIKEIISTKPRGYI